MVNGKNGGRELGMAYFKALWDAEPELMKIATPSKSLDLPDEVWHREDSGSEQVIVTL